VKRRLVLLGPPASGKGTQAAMISAKYGYPIASPGGMLREEKRAGTALGIEADKLTTRGSLLPDETIVALVKRWLMEHDGEFVFDGVPRTLGQAKALDALLEERRTPVDLVIALEAKLSTLEERVKNRLICSKCGQIVSLGLHVPSPDTPCPVCGGKLSKRSDDTRETLERRMLEYREKTEPLIAFYTKRGLLHKIDTTPTPERVFDSIAKILKA